jgi:molecular chaperone DnaK
MGTVAGIKIGMNYCSLAVLNVRGKPEVVLDLSGNRVIPAVVAFNGDGSALVGVEAKNRLSSAPSNVVQFVLRRMGDPSHCYLVAGAEYSPVEILALILKKLKEECVQLGDIEDIVITVPAHFNEIERKSTMDAGKIAGLNVLGVVNEPTAAAVYYASEISIHGNVVVYDLGASSFDVSIFRINREGVQPLASKGDGHLGGIDFDKEIVRHIVAQARKDIGHELFPDDFFNQMPGGSTDAEKTYFTLMDRAEKAKKQLSARDAATIRGNTLFGKFSAPITRGDFEEMISSHLVRTEMLLENALEDAGLSAGQIDKVVLVGGSTRIPKVWQMLESFFGFAPEISINPDEAVVLGAAIAAGKRKAASAGSAVVNHTSVVECANKFLGILSLSLNEARGERMMRNEMLIRRGSRLPCFVRRRHEVSTDCQRQIMISITESDEDISDPEHVLCIAKVTINLPQNCPKGFSICAVYGYDEDSRLYVNVELPNGQKYEAEISYEDKGDVHKNMEQLSVGLDAFIVE